MGYTEEESMAQKQDRRKRQFKFYECEHYGDLDHYAMDVSDSGGIVERSWMGCQDCEVGHVIVRLKYGVTWEEFAERFKQTDAFHFATGGQFVGGQ